MNEDAIVRIVHRCIDESPRINQIDHRINQIDHRIDRIEGDVSTLKSDVSSLKHSVNNLECEQRRQGVLFEHLQSKMDKIMDVVLDNSRRLTSMENFNDFKKHAIDRLDATDNTLRRHVKNRRVHRSVHN